MLTPTPSPTQRTVAYLATSVDGFIAGPGDDLDWLSAPRTSGLPFAADAWAAREAGGLGFEDFLARVGCLLMGRRTYDVVAGFDARRRRYGVLRALSACANS